MKKLIRILILLVILSGLIVIALHTFPEFESWLHYVTGWN